jgi:hypothetical protein
MAMKNDGGWCWGDVHHVVGRKGGGRMLAAYDLVVVSPPTHGHVLVGDVANGRVRVAYQPAPGFVGTDSFVTHFRVADTQLTWLVTVSK